MRSRRRSGPALVGAAAPHGINARGDIVGERDDAIFTDFHGYVLSRGAFLGVDAPGGVADPGGSLLMGINARGRLVGWFSDDVGVHGFVSDGVVFDTIDEPLAEPGSTIAAGINGVGQIVGFYFDAAAQKRRGSVATPVQ